MAGWLEASIIVCIVCVCKCVNMCTYDATMVETKCIQYIRIKIVLLSECIYCTSVKFVAAYLFCFFFVVFNPRTLCRCMVVNDGDNGCMWSHHTPFRPVFATLLVNCTNKHQHEPLLYTYMRLERAHSEESNARNRKNTIYDIYSECWVNV